MNNAINFSAIITQAHLEDLKSENSRLQRLVDVLDSQPELIFCITASGRITYVSERTINFIKIINVTSAQNGSNLPINTEESDDDPIHVKQILTKESAESLLESISKLRVLSLHKSSTENDLSMIFSCKVKDNFHFVE